MPSSSQRCYSSASAATLPVTAARLRPAAAPGLGVVLSLICLFAMLGGALATRALQGSPSPQPQATAHHDPFDATSPESRLRSVSGYVRLWNSRTGPDGIAHIRYEELRSCYNLMTGGEVLPDPGSPTPPVPHSQHKK